MKTTTKLTPTQEKTLAEIRKNGEHANVNHSSASSLVKMGLVRCIATSDIKVTRGAFNDRYYSFTYVAI